MVETLSILVNLSPWVVEYTFMNFRQKLALGVVVLPLVFFSSDTRASSPDWQIRGSLSEACSCAVPCRCNFGGLPSPHPYCYSIYSYKIKQGKFENTSLDGLKFGSVDAKYGRTVYIDQNADPAQRTALLNIAESVLETMSAPTQGSLRPTSALDM